MRDAKHTILNRVRSWLGRLENDNLVRRFGGVQQCPWCRQIAQSKEGWNFKPFADDAFLDVLTCGVCGGKSLWHFAMGMHYFGPLTPPQPLLSYFQKVSEEISKLPVKLHERGEPSP